MGTRHVRGRFPGYTSLPTAWIYKLSMFIQSVQAIMCVLLIDVAVEIWSIRGKMLRIIFFSAQHRKKHIWTGIRTLFNPLFRKLSFIK